jgi:hypothetical protein
MKPLPVASLTKEDWEIALRHFQGSSDRWWHCYFYATQRADRRDAELMYWAAVCRNGPWCMRWSLRYMCTLFTDLNPIGGVLVRGDQITYRVAHKG